MTIKKGNTVRLRYVGKLEDGSVFDSGVTEFEVGEGFVVEGIEEAVMGMEQGERKELTLPPEKAFGERKNGFKKAFSKHDLQGGELKEGDPVGVRTPTGKIAPCLVDRVTEDEVIVDLNHPLAGRTLTFEVEVVEVS